MFGILRPCRHHLNGELRMAWMAHLCGLCLALRDEHGHPARLTTNRDALVVSALVEAQSATGPPRRHAGPCVLRGLRGADVAVGPGPRLAACVSLLLVAAKLRDHAADGDGPLRCRRLAALAGRVASVWAEGAERTGAELGLHTSPLVSVVERQRLAEAAARPGTELTAVTAPVEGAVAIAFAHTAVLAGRPGNVLPLAAAGRAFGRAAHLVDAVEDLEADRRSGAWNPLLATGAGLAEARRVTDRAVAELRQALACAEVADGRLIHQLLAHETAHAVSRAFLGAVQTPPTEVPTEYPSPPPPGPPAPPPAPYRKPARPERGGGGWCGDGCGGCDCCRSCGDCCDCCTCCGDCCDCCTSCEHPSC